MSLIAELKRRNVFKVGAAYLALAWVIVQITGEIVPALNLPASLVPTVVWIGVVGFPCVLLFSWAYELTPEGLKRESEVDRSQSITHVTSKRLDYIIIALMVLAIALFAFHEFRPAPPVAPAVVQGASAQAVPAVVQPESQASATAAPQAATAVAADDKSIAVLPFVDMSQGKDQEYFSDGIAEELLNLLAKIPELEVVARTSSFAFKGKDVDIADIARKLDVAHILEGSVRKSGNKLRITAQLINAANGRHLWSETYDREMTDIFVIQDEIAAAVVAQLKITLLGAAPTVRPGDPRAYPLTLQAQALIDQSTPTAYTQAIALYQQALAIDPDEARAWSGLGRAYLNQSIDGLRSAAEGSGLAKDALNKALALDPDDAVALSRLSGVANLLDNEPTTAAQYLQRALALDPVNMSVLRSTGLFLGSLGRLDQAALLEAYVANHDPANPTAHQNLGFRYFQLGRWDQAVASIRNTLSLSPAYTGGHLIIGQALLLGAGDAAAALQEMQAEPDETSRLLGVALAEHALGHAAESDTALAAVIARHASDQAAGIARVYAWRGEADRAFDWLGKAIANREILSELAFDPLFGSLKSDPRGLPFLRKLGKAPEQLAAIEFKVVLPK